MVALFHPTRFPSAPAPAPAERPDLRLIRGGLDSPSTDRSGALATLAVLAVVVAVIGLRLLQGGPPSSASPVRDVTVAAADLASGESVRVIREGDTLWAIAEALAPGQDPRPIVDALADRNGGTTLRVGDVMVVPAALADGAVTSTIEAGTLASAEPAAGPTPATGS